MVFFYSGILKLKYGVGFSYIPLLAKKHFTQWKTDMIFFDNGNIIPSPNFFVQKLLSLIQGDVYFDKVVTKNDKDTTQAASCVGDSKSGDTILKLVNFGKVTKTMEIYLSGFGNLIPEAE